MSKFKVGQGVVLRGRVGAIDGASVSLVSGSQVIWLPRNILELLPAPVTVRCELGINHPLTDIKTARGRCEALGIKAPSLGPDLVAFTAFCDELAEKGVTAEQFREGL